MGIFDFIPLKAELAAKPLLSPLQSWAQLGEQSLGGTEEFFIYLFYLFLLWEFCPGPVALPTFLDFIST